MGKTSIWIVLLLATVACGDPVDDETFSGSSNGGGVPEACGGIQGAQCSNAEEVCIYESGTCGAADRQGECVATGDACIQAVIRVCGCDGNTYMNECFATMAGVSIDHVRSCSAANEVCGGIQGLPCLNRLQTCIYPLGTCNVSDNFGLCIDTGPCPGVVDPVCGCDGQTYTNECLAWSNSVSVDYRGACQP